MTSQSLLLVGSTKGKESTSESLGSFLSNQLEERGMETNTIMIHPSLKSEKGQQELLSAVDSADLIILAFPLYMHNLPAPVIKAMELIAQKPKAKKRQRFAVIVNCGFPGHHNNDNAIAICQCFASYCDMEWAGALSLGEGGAINGNPLERIRGFARKVMKSLTLAASALAEDKPIPKEAIDLMSRDMVPRKLYLIMANRLFKKTAKKYGTKDKLYDRPYL